VLAWRRRWREAALIALPLAMLWIFNALGFWPMGAFRTNVFAIIYTTAVAAMAFDVPDSGSGRWLAPIPTLVVVILPLLAFERVWHSRKLAFTYDSRFPRLIERLVDLRQSRGKAPLILDRRSCPLWRFYTMYHPRTSAAYTPLLTQSYEPICLTDDSKIPATLAETATTKQAVWIVLHVGHGIDQLYRERGLRDLYRISRFEVGPHTVMSFRRRRPQPVRTEFDSIE
jgi:hypothetical protein